MDIDDLLNADPELVYCFCDCGNTAFYKGFYACDFSGAVVDITVETWSGLYLCRSCARILDFKRIQGGGEVLGIAKRT